MRPRHVLPLFVLLSMTAYAEEQVFYSPLLTIHRTYRSMEGPYWIQDVNLGTSRKSTLLWITGVIVRVVDENLQPLPDEYFCHANLDVHPIRHRAEFPASILSTSRLFTLSQGLTEIEFPHGFGIPVMSDEPLSVFTQALNHNADNLRLRVRIAVTVRFQSEKTRTSMTALRVLPAHGLVLTSDAHDAHGTHDNIPLAGHGTDVGSTPYHDSIGRPYSGHWVVRPGRSINRTMVDQAFEPRASLLVHQIALHVHPFAKSMTLWDRSNQTVIWQGHIENAGYGIGIERIDSYSSPTGLLIEPPMKYDLVTEYNNTTADNQTAMAVMFLFVRDEQDYRKTAQAGTHRR